MLKPRWKPFMTCTVDGKPAVFDGEFLNTEPNLLERIAAMPRKIPITIHQAQNMFWDRVSEICFDENDPVASAHFCTSDWIAWISVLGFHVHLAGDEYELIPELDC